MTKFWINASSLYLCIKHLDLTGFKWSSYRGVKVYVGWIKYINISVVFFACCEIKWIVMVNGKPHSFISYLWEKVLTSSFKNIVLDSIWKHNLLEIIWYFNNNSFFASRLVSICLICNVSHIKFFFIGYIIYINHFTTTVLLTGNYTIVPWVLNHRVFRIDYAIKNCFIIFVDRIRLIRLLWTV